MEIGIILHKAESLNLVMHVLDVAWSISLLNLVKKVTQHQKLQKEDCQDLKSLFILIAHLFVRN